MPKKKKTAEGYPYSIPPFPPHDKISEHPHPGFVNLYFQIEVLLRSPKVRTAYRQDDTHQQFRSFFKKIGIGVDPLAGKHHLFICADITIPDKEFDEAAARFGCVKEGVTDLTVVMKHGPSDWWPNGGEAAILQQLRNPAPRFLYFRLDVSRSADGLLKTLRSLIAARRKQFMKTPADNPLDQFYRALPGKKGATPFQDLETWRRYFQCYDLQQTTVVTVEEIANQVYGGDADAVNKGMIALRRVRKAIRSAEEGIWPPPDLS